jgi:hypothetical protein
LLGQCLVSARSTRPVEAANWVGLAHELAIVRRTGAPDNAKALALPSAILTLVKCAEIAAAGRPACAAVGACNGIAHKLTWVGIGPHKVFDDPDHPNSPRVTFDHFWYRGERGPLLEEKYPALANRMYEKNVRVLMHSQSPVGRHQVGKICELDRNVKKILRLARNAPSSNQLAKRKFHNASGKRQSKTC